jgi:hypothetical protein
MKKIKGDDFGEQQSRNCKEQKGYCMLLLNYPVHCPVCYNVLLDNPQQFGIHCFAIKHSSSPFCSDTTLLLDDPQLH